MVSDSQELSRLDLGSLELVSCVYSFCEASMGIICTALKDTRTL